MSYAIFTVYYGIPLSTGRRRSTKMHDFIENGSEGVHTHYSGSADEEPAAFGVNLKAGFDECCHHVELSDIPLAPTEKQKKEFDALFKALSAEDQAIVKTAGEPRIFFLASTS